MHLTNQQIDELIAKTAEHPHLSECAVCYLKFTHLGGVHDGNAPDSLTLDIPEGETIEPGPGQIWRFTYDDVALFGYVVAASDWAVEVLPITAQPRLVVDAAEEWNQAESPIGFSAAVWNTESVELPKVTLDRCYGTIEIGQQIETKPVGERGAGLLNQWYEAAEKLRQVNGTPQETSSFAEFLENHSLDSRSLASKLSLAPGDAVAVAQGNRELTSDERQQLSAITDVEVDQIPEPSWFDELMAELVEPMRRSAVRRYGAQHGVDEMAARKAIRSDFLGAAARSNTPPVERFRAYLDELV